MIAENDSVSVGTNLEYARIHNEGGRIKAKSKKGLFFKIGDRWSRKKQVDIPKREYLGIGKKEILAIKETVKSYLDAIFTK